MNYTGAVAVAETESLRPTPDDQAASDARTAALFARAAHALAHDRRVIGAAITTYCERHATTDEELAHQLGLANVTALHQLMLCTRPTPSSPTFAAEVDALATYFTCDADRLRQLLTEIAQPRDGR
jgi:hypothetical protein